MVEAWRGGRTYRTVLKSKALSEKAVQEALAAADRQQARFRASQNMNKRHEKPGETTGKVWTKYEKVRRKHMKYMNES